MIIRIWLCLCLVLWGASAQAQTILVIESYHSEYPWVKNYRAGLEEILRSDHKLVYFEMDTKRLPESEYSSRATAAWELYQKLSPSLVILADDNALKFLGPKLVNDRVPVVYLGINGNPRDYGVANAPNFSGVLERPLILRSISMLKQFIPVKRALLLLDAKPTSKMIRDDIFYGNNSIVMSGISVDVKLVERFSQWKEFVLSAKSKGYDILIPALYHGLIDEAGNHFDPTKAIEWTSENTEIPPFGFWGFSIDARKSIGGYVVSGYEQGKLAAEVAHELLSENKLYIRIKTGERGKFIFSKTQLEKWKIELPENLKDQTLLVD